MSAREYEMQVRFSDFDAWGHMNNAVYLSYLEDARAWLYRDMHPGFFELSRSIGARPVVGGQRIDYLREVSFGTERLVGRVWVSALGRASHTVCFELLSRDLSVVHAAAESVIVQVALDGSSTVALSQAQRDGLSAWSGEALTFRR